jgi:hypothetical protein
LARRGEIIAAGGRSYKGFGGVLDGVELAHIPGQ